MACYFDVISVLGVREGGREGREGGAGDRVRGRWGCNEWKIG